MKTTSHKFAEMLKESLLPHDLKLKITQSCQAGVLSAEQLVKLEKYFLKETSLRKKELNNATEIINKITKIKLNHVHG